MMSSRYSDEAMWKKREKHKVLFYQRVKEKHGDRFDLSRAEFVTQKTPTTFGCPKHGWFETTPDKFLRSFGCPKCGVEERAKNKSKMACKRFYKIFKEKLADTFNLITECEGSKKPIIVECKAKGHRIETIPDRLNIFFKNGCPTCNRRQPTKSQEQFIAEAKGKFPDLDFSKTIYVGSERKITITCPIHGDQEVLVRSFFRSNYGCTECGNAQIGYAGYRIQKLESDDPSIIPRPTRIAVMKMNIWGIETYKLGVTVRTLEARYRESLKEVYFEAVLDEIDALKLEQLLHQKYEKDKDERIFKKGMRDGERWSGDTELYFKRALKPMLADIKSHVEELAKHDLDYWKRYPELKMPSFENRVSKFNSGEYNAPRPVICLDDLMIYPSATEAAQAIGASQGNLSMTCQGKRSKCKGKRYAYLDDYENGTVPKFMPSRGCKRYVRCIDTGEVFSSITEAAKAIGAQGSKITTVCRGKRKTTGGYHWEYVDDLTV